MTLQELAEREYPEQWVAGAIQIDVHHAERTAFLKGLQVGMECIDWAIKDGWVLNSDDKWIKFIGDNYTTEELLSIYLKEKQ